VIRGLVRFCVALAFLACALPARAQTPPFIPDVPEIRRLLESTTPRDQAWGAWFAVQAQARDLAPLLRAVATGNMAAAEWQDTLATTAALDALIQLGTPQPAAWARSFFDRWPAQSLILLARGGEDATAELLPLTSSQTGIRWLTAANVLLQRRAPGFAAILFRDLEIAADLTIVSKGNETLGSAGGGADVGVGHGASARVPGFPPLAGTFRLRARRCRPRGTTPRRPRRASASITWRHSSTQPVGF